MCEVNVTCLIEEVDPFVLSHGRAEAGSANKWSDALAIAEDRDLPGLIEEDVRDYFAGFGAWEPEEIAAWSRQDMVALVLQYAAGDLRELQSLCPGDELGDIDWEEAEALAREGTVGGNLYPMGEELFITICD